jgi:hypothetical protein
VTEPPFEARMLAGFHRLVPDVTTVLVPQRPAPSSFGVHAAQVERETAAAMSTVLTTLATLWPELTGDLPAPPTVGTHWMQESGHTSAVLAVVSARYDGPLLDRVDRVAAAERVLGARGWAWSRRDPRAPRDLRLLAHLGRTLVEVSAHARPRAYDVEVRHGPVLTGRYGSDLVAAPTRTVPFPACER